LTPALKAPRSCRHALAPEFSCGLLGNRPQSLTKAALYDSYYNIMSKQAEFVKKVEVVLNARIGPVLATSTLNYYISKLDKDVASLTAEDCKALAENLLNSASLFVTKEEAKLIRFDLENLVRTCS